MSIRADYSNRKDWHCVLKSIYYIYIYFFQTDWKHNLSYLIGFWFHTIRKESKIISFACPFHIFTTRNKIRSRKCPSRKYDQPNDRKYAQCHVYYLHFKWCYYSEILLHLKIPFIKLRILTFCWKFKCLLCWRLQWPVHAQCSFYSHGRLCNVFFCSVCMYFILKYSFAEICFSSGWEWCPENVISFITITSGYSKLYPFWECCLLYTRRQLIMF